METLQVTKIERAETIEALNRSEIDIQISTAKKYPRDITLSVSRIAALATVNEEVAEECFYSLRRQGKSGESVINGPSVRLAEIVAQNWGNLRAQAQIISNDGKFIVARGICHDLETNYAVSVEVQRRICDKYGKPFSDDMQVVTSNAAAAIAYRNAVFKVVPMSLLSGAVEQIKEKANGETENLPEVRQKMLKYYAGIGVTEPMILSFLGIGTVDEIDSKMVSELRGIKNAIKEHDTTPEEQFINPYREKEKQKTANRQQAATAGKVAQAMAKQKASPEPAGAQEAADDMPIFQQQ
ncbi:MAG: hypothetical protein KBS89_07500 [Bacteroidales bacterium]|nr:hypothetical protein [Candidatus Egerieousia equi]